MQKYCPVCDQLMDDEVCPVHSVPTVDEACFNRAHVPIVPGDRVDDQFMVVRILGEGSMGTVYEVATESGDKLALKVIKVREDSSRQVTKRFYREALAGSKVSHRGIVKIFQFGVDERTGQPYQAMEFIEGVTLFDYMDSSPKSLAEVTEIADGILEALEHLHGCGIVHRDLKPENVMLVRNGSNLSVKLLDFGIAKILEHDGDAPTLTATGVAVGTPHYMSPEQAKGSKVSIHADFYSLGCIIFELLSGRPPFDGSDFMSVLISHVRDPVPHLAPMTPWGEAIPEAVRDTVYKNLSKDPLSRASNAVSMMKSLGGNTLEEALSAQRDSGFSEGAKMSNARLFNSFTLTLVVVVLLLGVWLLI